MAIKAEMVVSPEIVDFLSDEETKKIFEQYMSEILLKKWLEELDKNFLENKDKRNRYGQD